MESCPTQAVLPLVGLAAEKVIRDRYSYRRDWIMLREEQLAGRLRRFVSGRDSRATAGGRGGASRRSGSLGLRPETEGTFMPSPRHAATGHSEPSSARGAHAVRRVHGLAGFQSADVDGVAWSFGVCRVR
ncbi:MAG: hypothetical protein ACQESR_06480 [Planctomycetota bacterium]